MADRETVLELEGYLRDGDLDVDMRCCTNVSVSIDPVKVAMDDRWFRKDLYGRHVHVTVEVLGG